MLIQHPINIFRYLKHYCPFFVNVFNRIWKHGLVWIIQLIVFDGQKTILRVVMLEAMDIPLWEKLAQNLVAVVVTKYVSLLYYKEVKLFIICIKFWMKRIVLGMCKWIWKMSRVVTYGLLHIKLSFYVFQLSRVMWKLWI